MKFSKALWTSFLLSYSAYAQAATDEPQPTAKTVIEGLNQYGGCIRSFSFQFSPFFYEENKKKIGSANISPDYRDRIISQSRANCDDGGRHIMSYLFQMNIAAHTRNGDNYPSVLRTKFGLALDAKMREISRKEADQSMSIYEKPIAKGKSMEIPSKNSTELDNLIDCITKESENYCLVF